MSIHLPKSVDMLTLLKFVPAICVETLGNIMVIVGMQKLYKNLGELTTKMVLRPAWKAERPWKGIVFDSQQLRQLLTC